MSQPNQRYGFDPRRANEGGAPYQQNYQNQQVMSIISNQIFYLHFIK